MGIKLWISGVRDLHHCYRVMLRLQSGNYCLHCDSCYRKYRFCKMNRKMNFGMKNQKKMMMSCWSDNLNGSLKKSCWREALLLMMSCRLYGNRSGNPMRNCRR